MDSPSSTRTSGSRVHLVEEYLDRVAAHDVVGARTLVLARLAVDDGLAALIDEVLVPAMAEVGNRWYRGHWSAAQEHVASGITETVLSAASVRTRSRRPAPGAPTAVLACPRGEEHVLPARFAAELLVEAGADVIILGLPVPDPDLAGFLAEVRPCALIVSCTEPLTLPGVRTAVSAAHSVGVPTLVGGAGIGPDGRRAAALGADGWAHRADEAVHLLRTWGEQTPELATARLESSEVAALLAVPAGPGDLLGPETDRDRVVVDVAGVVVRALTSALLCDDDRLFRDRVTWVKGLFEARGMPLTVLDDALATADDVLRDQEVPRALRLLASA